MLQYKTDWTPDYWHPRETLWCPAIYGQPDTLVLGLGRGWLSSVVVGLVIERSRVRLPAGALPGSLGQLSLPSLRGR